MTGREIGVGVALLPVVGVAIPFSLGTGTQSPIVAAMLFAGCLLLAWFVAALLGRRFRLVDSPVVLPTAALMIVWLLALVSSDAVRDPLVWVPPTWTLIQLGGLSVAIVPAAMLLLALHSGFETRSIQWCTWSFIGIGAVATLGFAGDAVQSVTDRLLQTGGLFTMWLVALAYGQALFNHKLGTGARIALAGLALAWVFKALVLQTWWFSGWVPSLVVIGALTLLRSRSAFLLLGLACTFAVTANFDAVYDVVWGTTLRKGDLTRLDIWNQTLDLVSHYPLLGTGPAGYAVYFQSIYAGSHFSLSTHNTYLDVLAQTGVVGCVVFAWFIVALGWVGWQARSRWRTGFLGGYAQGVFAGLLGLVVAMSQGDWLIPFVYNQTIAGFRYTIHSWVFLGFLSSLALVRPTSEAD